jgi:methyltransferase (TIGR00027 family)
MPRLEADTWDLASSVGATATAVAAGRALASQDALLDDPLAEPLVRAVGVEHFVKMVDGEIALDDDPVLNRRALNEQMAVRTRFFDHFFLESGLTQAVILAAGLDTRAYRLNWPARNRGL